MSIFGLKGLGSKIAVTALGFSLLPLLALGLIMGRHVRVCLSCQGPVQSGHPGREQTAGIDLLRDQIAQLRVLASTHSIDDLSSQDKLESMLISMQQNSRTFIDLGLIDEEGRHVSYCGPYNLADANYKNEVWFHRVMVQRVYVSDVFKGFRGFPHMVIAVTKQERARSGSCGPPSIRIFLTPWCAGFSSAIKVMPIWSTGPGSFKLGPVSGTKRIGLCVPCGNYLFRSTGS